MSLLQKCQCRILNHSQFSCSQTGSNWSWIFDTNSFVFYVQPFWTFWGSICKGQDDFFCRLSCLPRNTGNWPALAGVQDSYAAATQFQLFWDRFRVLRPNHQIFEYEKSYGIPLAQCAPFMLHGDEGRGKKRLPVLCISAHSALGRGVETRQKKRKLDHRDGGEQQMNYLGMTHCGRYLMSVLPKVFYESDDSTTFQNLVEFLSKDLFNLCTQGVLGCDNRRYYICIIYCKGDWPWLHKIAGLNRSFYNQPKKESSRKPCGGICHYCLAGRPNIPFEDTTHSAEWQFTMGIEAPWDQRPVILDYCTHDPGFPETFFAVDPWHTWHLGEGRNFVCNVMHLLLGITPGRNVGARLDRLFFEYKTFCSQNKCQCYASKFSLNLFGISANDYPHGGWTKGNFTTSLVKWLATYLHENRNSFERGSLLEKAVALAGLQKLFHSSHNFFLGYRGLQADFFLPLLWFRWLCLDTKAVAAKEINECFSKMYVAPLWIPSDHAKVICNHGFTYLKMWREMAHQAAHERKALFLYNSKIHMLTHILRNLEWEAELAYYTLNPMVWGVQLDEDLIGKACRLARHVSSNPYFMVRRSLQRWLIASYTSWSKSRMLNRCD